MFRKCLLFFMFSLFSFVYGQEIIVVGIAGGTASGKTTIAEKIHEAFPETSIIISQDNYYRDLTHLSKKEQNKVNFDHPKSIDFELLEKHIRLLKEGSSIQEPIYDFCTHGRKKTTIAVEPKRIIIVEGILVLAVSEIRNLFDVKIFVDTDDDIRLLRRIERDIKDRNRTFESIRDQYLATVQPMHNEFVEPSKRYADFIIPRGGENTIALSMITSQLREHLQSAP